MESNETTSRESESISPAVSQPDSSPTPDLLLLFLRDRDYPCPGCGYNLRQLLSPKCPECGQPLKLGVNLVDIRHGFWITCLLGCSFPAGFGVIALVVMAIYASSFSFSNFELSAALWLLYLIGMIPATVALILRRRAFVKLSRQAQAGLAVIPWVIIVVILGMIFTS